MELEVKVYNKKAEEKEKKKIKILPVYSKTDKDLVSFVLRGMLANARAPIAHVKTRGEVKGGGRKPWRQKGTGRARAGSIRSPLWKGGGVVFGPQKQRNFAQKINKKMRKKALALALKDKIEQNKLIILETPDFNKTKDFYNFILKIVGQGKKIIYFMDPSEKKLGRFLRNIADLKVLFPDTLNLKDILWADFLLSSSLGFKDIEKRLNFPLASSKKKQDKSEKIKKQKVNLG